MVGKTPEKECPHCKVTKARTIKHWHLFADGKDGLHSVCKPCRRAYNLPRSKQWRRDNRERRNEYMRIYWRKKQRERQELK